MLPLVEPLRATVDDLVGDFDAIPSSRKALLEQLASIVTDGVGDSQTVSLNFICTHNSRRSHMAQLWSSAAIGHYGVLGVATYSGGTEATAFNPRAVAAMRRAGFGIDEPSGLGRETNPRYQVRYSQAVPPVESFSKTYNDPSNPQENFVAVMTCSEADEACPVVLGAARRIAIAYEDPKASDGTPQESGTYDARCAQIGTEMLYWASRVPRGR